MTPGYNRAQWTTEAGRWTSEARAGKRSGGRTTRSARRSASATDGPIRSRLQTAIPSRRLLVQKRAATHELDPHLLECPDAESALREHEDGGRSGNACDRLR